MTEERERLVRLISAELDHAYAKHGRDPWGRHEFYGVLKEEVDELWDAIKSDAPMSDVLDELVQVAAMCFRYYETGDRYRGVPHPLSCPMHCPPGDPSACHPLIHRTCGGCMNHCLCDAAIIRSIDYTEARAR